MQKYKIIYLHIHTYIVLSSYSDFTLYIYILSFILPPYFPNFLSFILDFYARSCFYIYIHRYICIYLCIYNGVIKHTY